ncbi:MAG: class I SAM-dependent methyltransferase [Gemmataceae bacterium]|nr:class I SAM-dependent methyltransferase [Gemmataceae bacterium]
MTANPFYRRRTTCRLCNSTDVACAFQLEPSALAEWYLPPARAHEATERFPLDLFLCKSCGHVQLFDVIDPVRLFANYVYTSASSPGLEEHFRRYADAVADRLTLAPESLVVDVGSNDGTLLRQFSQRGMRVVGIDPAREIARDATAKGIPTVCGFMDRETAGRILSEHGPAQLCTANNVFAHNDELGDMADAIASLLADDGAFVFEVSYLLDTVQGLVFDFIYHEHLCYHSVKPMEAFLRRHGMHLFDVEWVPSKGGSLRGFAQKLGGPRGVSPHVAEFVAREESAGLYETATYGAYIARVNRLRDQTTAYLQDCRAHGKSVAGYGASATVTTLLHHFKIGEMIDFLVDDNPIRPGTLSPGFGKPVKSPQALYDDKPDVVLIAAWRFAEAIIKRHPAYLQQGGTFIVPLPVFREHRGTAPANAVTQSK